jgi:hypothetical protein
MSHVSSALHLTSQCQEPLASQGLMSQGLMSHVASQSEGAGTLAAEGRLAAAKGCRRGNAPGHLASWKLPSESCRTCCWNGLDMERSE